MAVQVELIKEIKPFALDQDTTFFFHSEKDEGKTNSYISPVPTMDIWKKFELLPTPPRSPSRSPCESPVHMNLASVADTLQIVSEILDDDEAASSQPPPEKNCISLKSKLIQDCMWNSSAFEAFTDLTRVLTNPAEDLYETPCSTPPPVEYISSDCVDPAAVFPYPINDTQSFCSSHTSDSEEEIDVVTIEKPAPAKRKLSVETIEKPTPEDEDDTKDEPPVKKIRPIAVRAKPVPQPTHSKLKRQMSSGSDDEDCESKRATHNVLERKRRNDLKTSFHQLRAEVPELEENERSPKVTILRKARDYVEQLKTEESKLLLELEREKERHKQLQKRYNALGSKRN